MLSTRLLDLNFLAVDESVLFEGDKNYRLKLKFNHRYIKEHNLYETLIIFDHLIKPEFLINGYEYQKLSRGLKYRGCIPIYNKDVFEIITNKGCIKITDAVIEGNFRSKVKLYEDNYKYLIICLYHTPEGLEKNKDLKNLLKVQ